ncbi:hypothetical protein CC79DRAFT_1323816 [Sarocladium strictum]
MSQPSGSGRIAIKFGSGNHNKPSSSSRPAPPSALGKRSRSQPWGHDDDDSGSDDGRHNGTHETITGFGASGAESEDRRKKPEKKEFVISRQPNRDWKAEARGKRGRHTSPPGRANQETAQGKGEVVETEPADQDKDIQWGLTITRKDKTEEDEKEAEQEPEEPSEEVPKSPPQAPRTADDEALDALLGKAPKKDDLVIPSAPLTEDTAYQAAVATAGEASTLADYEAMPVEEFGAALLRGMGWDGKERAPSKKPVVRRPNRLGLGAKELKDAEDLGAWDQGKKRGGGREKRPPKLSEYRREEEKRKDRRGEDSYKREREREKERDRGYGRDRRDREYDSGRDRHRDRDYDRHRRR